MMDEMYILSRVFDAIGARNPDALRDALPKLKQRKFKRALAGVRGATIPLNESRAHGGESAE